MSGAVLVADVSRPVSVHGVHGAAGRTSWSCLARRPGLDGGWEAVEWASVPPGGVSGEHAHTRTEEIYFVLAGQGELLLDGVARPMRQGTLALTKVGSRHGLRNVGATQLDWLVIELLSPATEAVVRDRPALRQEDTMDSTVVDLRARVELDPREVFASPLERVAIETLGPGERRQLVADGREHTLFVLAGAGTGHSGAIEVALAPSTGVTLPLGSRLDVAAGPEGLEYFCASLVVEPGR